MIKIVKLYREQKYIGDEFKKDVNHYKNRYVNLNLNYHMVDDPSLVKRHYYSDENSNKMDISTTNDINYVTLWTKFYSESNQTKDILIS